MSAADEYIDILTEIRRNSLQFLGLINMNDEEAIKKMKELDTNVYNSLKRSVEYHARKKSTIPSTQIKYTKNIPTTLPAKIKNTTADTKTDNTKVYESVLNPSSRVTDIDTKYLVIRAKYLTELKALENKPGCTGCQKNSLRRKFIEELKKLDNEL